MSSTGSRKPLVERIREQRRRHKDRRRVTRVAVVLVGFVVMLVGLALIPLPGPGLLVTAVGLGLLALEFAWAERVLERTIDRMEQASERVKRAGRIQQALLGALGVLVGLASIVAMYAWDIPLLPV